MAVIRIMGEVYDWETSINNKTITITDQKTGEWTIYHDDLNTVGDPDFYEDWGDWIYDNWDEMIWFPGEEDTRSE